MKLLILVVLSISAWAQYTTQLMPDSVQQFLTNTGTPCASCKLYTYSAGTTTPLATYTDNTLGVPNANPVILDSSGRARVWLSNVGYKLELRTSADVVIKTMDNVLDVGLILKRDLGDGTNDALNASMVAYRPTGGSVTTVRSALEGAPVNVKTFGATGDGATNDTTNFQAAVTAAATSGKGMVFVPIGTYSLSLITIPSSMTIYCESPQASLLSLRTGNTILYATNTGGITIQNCGFTGTGSGAGGGAATSDGLIEMLNVTNLRIIDNYFNSVTATRCIDLENVQRVWIQNNHFNTVTASGIRLNDPGASKINSHVWIEDNVMTTVGGTGAGAGAIQVYGTVAAGADQQYIHIARNEIAATNVGIGVDRGSYVTIEDNRVTGNATTGEGIAFTGRHFTVSRNRCNNNIAAGILYYATATQGEMEWVTIEDNVVYDNAQGIAYVYGQNASIIKYLQIRRNRAFNTASGPAQSYGIQSYCNSAGGSCLNGDMGAVAEQHLTITDNDLMFNATGGYNLALTTILPTNRVLYFNRTSQTNSRLDNTDFLNMATVDVAQGSVRLDSYVTDQKQNWFTLNSNGSGNQRSGVNFSSNQGVQSAVWWNGPGYELAVTNSAAESYTNFYIADQTIAGLITISAISAANPAVLTVSSVPAGLIVGSHVYIIGIANASCKHISERPRYVSAIAGSNITIDADGTTCVYTTGAGLTSVSLAATIEKRGFTPKILTFANLTGASIPFIVWCSDCNVVSAAPHACTGGGTGAWGFRNGGTWKCPF